MPAEQRSPGAETVKEAPTARILAMSLRSPANVEKLQNSLHEKAKQEPNFRFYSLWDKIYRIDVLREAFRRCRRNGGAAGVDRVTFQAIETKGSERWLGNLSKELREGQYEPQPLRRVWIPKRNGGLRPLGVPTIKCRVVQTAAVLVLGPIFEADLLPAQYGYRPGLGAKMAVRRVYYHITQRGCGEVVDADLSDYFGSIPHVSLMKCLSRRIADGRILSIAKTWLNVPVVEITCDGHTYATNESRRKKRGTCQGGPLLPLLGNLYFRRFLLAWERYRPRELRDARVVSYADDLVVCCPPGKGYRAREVMTKLMSAIGLAVNEEKTRTVSLSAGTFEFLGYRFGYLYGVGGRKYFGTQPSRRSISNIKEKVHEATARNRTYDSLEVRIRDVNRILRGWGNYFDQGPVQRAYREVNDHTWRRLRRWLGVKHKAKGRARRPYTMDYLYEHGLHRLPEVRTDRARAKS